MAILNLITGSLSKFIDTYIVHVPEEKREAYIKHLEELLCKAVESAAHGAVEGTKK